MGTKLDLERFGKVVGMCGSAHDGERASAALQATRMLNGVGMTWADLVEAMRRPAPTVSRGPSPVRPSSWRGTNSQSDAAMCLMMGGLTDWEVGFCQSIAKRGARTDREREVLAGIRDKVARNAKAAA